MKEIWKDITIRDNIFLGKYQVSNLGRVKSLNYKRGKKEGILKQRSNGGGYLIVGLCSIDKVVHTMKVHQLVAYEFCRESYKEGYECHHINHVRTDNRAENLCWLSRKEHNGKRVRCVELDLEFDSITQAGAYLGHGVGNISSCLKKGRKKAYGYHWEYID